MQILQTSTDKKHYHIIASDGSSAVTTTAKKHTHQIISDPVTGQAMVYPAMDGHTHTIQPLETHTVKPSGDLTDTESVSEIKALHEEAINNDADFRTQGNESEEYFYGDTWTDAEKTGLKDKRRAPSAVNEIEPKIDVLSGYQRQNRNDIKFYPVEDGDVVVADVLDVLWKHTSEANNYDHKKSRVFDDASVVGRGLFQMRIDKSDDITGKIVVEKYQWNGVRFGPHEEPDLSDLEYLIKERWYSKAKLKSLWPDKSDGIEASYNTVLDADKTHIPRGDMYASDTNVRPTALQGSDRYVDLFRKSILVAECWRKEYKRVPVLFNSAADFYLSGENYRSEDLRVVAKEVPGFEIFMKAVVRMRVTTIAHDVLLDDDYTDEAYGDYSIIPLYAKKRGKRIWGKVHGMKYLARENNALHSKFVDIIDKAAGHGWFYDEITFANQAAKQHFEKVRNQSGWSAEVKDLGRLPVKVEGVKVPVELVGLIDHNSQKMREISNVVNELLGLNSKAESGVAIGMKKEQGLIGNEFLFDNLRLTEWQIGKRFIKMVPIAFSPKKIMRILANQNAKSPIKIDNVPYSDLSPEKLMAIEQVLSTEDYSNYDIVVSQAKTNPTTRIANFNLAIQILQAFPDVGQYVLDMVIKMSDFPEKDEWVQRIQQVVAAREQQQLLAMAASTQGAPASGNARGNARGNATQ